MAPEDGKFDPSQHLYDAYIALVNLCNPNLLFVSIKQLKTDPFRQGAMIILGRTHTQLCPVAALLAYLAAQGPGGSPLFYFKGGRALPHTHLVAEVRHTLAACTLRPEADAGYSFKFGGSDESSSLQCSTGDNYDPGPLEESSILSLH